MKELADILKLKPHRNRLRIVNCTLGRLPPNHPQRPALEEERDELYKLLKPIGYGTLR